MHDKQVYNFIICMFIWWYGGKINQIVYDFMDANLTLQVLYLNELFNPGESKVNIGVELFNADHFFELHY